MAAPIVVADDDAVGRELVSRVLEKAGHATVTAPDGEQAWELIQAVKPALAVLDWDMPHLTGLDVLRRVKLTVDRTPPYVLLLTSRTEVRDRVRGLTVGRRRLPDQAVRARRARGAGRGRPARRPAPAVARGPRRRARGGPDTRQSPGAVAADLCAVQADPVGRGLARPRRGSWPPDAVCAIQPRACPVLRRGVAAEETVSRLPVPSRFAKGARDRRGRTGTGPGVSGTWCTNSITSCS